MKNTLAEAKKMLEERGMRTTRNLLGGYSVIELWTERAFLDGSLVGVFPLSEAGIGALCASLRAIPKPKKGKR